MKYLKTYESITNYSVDVLTAEEFKKLYNKLYPYNYDDEEKNINLKDIIEYFSWSNLSGYGGGDKHNNSIRLITAYNDKEILGICFFAWWEGSSSYSVSYLSTNNNYFHSGISKKLLEELFKYFTETYPNETMGWSQYTIEGWKYLHPKILELSKKYNVKVKEQAIGHVKQWTDENRELYDKSKEEIKRLYNLNDYDLY